MKKSKEAKTLQVLQEMTEAVRLSASYREARKALIKLGANFTDAHAFTVEGISFSLPARGARKTRTKKGAAK